MTPTAPTRRKHLRIRKPVPAKTPPSKKESSSSDDSDSSEDEAAAKKPSPGTKLNAAKHLIKDWQNLPVVSVIFGDLTTMVGLESLDTLHTCRQVCQSWNGMIVSNEVL